MAHNIDNRRQRELRQRRAYMKALRRFDAFERQPNAHDKKPEERYRLWLKCWRARHPSDSHDEKELARIYTEQSPVAK